MATTFGLDTGGHTSVEFPFRLYWFRLMNFTIGAGVISSMREFEPTHGTEHYLIAFAKIPKPFVGGSATILTGNSLVATTGTFIFLKHALVTGTTYDMGYVTLFAHYPLFPVVLFVHSLSFAARRIASARDRDTQSAPA